MNTITWNKFKKARGCFCSYVKMLSESLSNLKNIQQELINNRSDGKTPAYTVDTPVVYNRALDDITVNDEIKLILVADNPGRREQTAENRRYLTGPSGKIADKFFTDNPALGIDFKKNVIILNKTPIHSPRTVELRELCRMDPDKFTIKTAVEESQKIMSSLLLEFHEAFVCPVWITGYSEMRKGGIFGIYTENLKKMYTDKKELINKLFIYRHFSMNQFTIDLKQKALPEETVRKSLKRIGADYRYRILGQF